MADWTWEAVMETVIRNASSGRRVRVRPLIQRFHVEHVIKWSLGSICLSIHFINEVADALVDRLLHAPENFNNYVA